MKTLPILALSMTLVTSAFAGDKPKPPEPSPNDAQQKLIINREELRIHSVVAMRQYQADSAALISTLDQLYSEKYANKLTEKDALEMRKWIDGRLKNLQDDQTALAESLGKYQTALAREIKGAEQGTKP